MVIYVDGDWLVGRRLRAGGDEGMMRAVILAQAGGICSIAAVDALKVKSKG